MAAAHPVIRPSLFRSNRNLQRCSTRVASGPKMSHAREPKPPSSAQSTNSVLMVRPSRFYPNPETATDNAFQRRVDCDITALTTAARREFDIAVQALREAGVKVHVFEDTAEPEKPDAVFPNNWISTHEDGRVAPFPMYSALRRRQRRQDVLDELGPASPATRWNDHC